MKYAIVLNGDLNAPHLKIYTNILEDKGIPYDVISWDRGDNFEKSEFTYSKLSAYKESDPNHTAQYSKTRSRESENFIVFLGKGLWQHSSRQTFQK